MAPSIDGERPRDVQGGPAEGRGRSARRAVAAFGLVGLIGLTTWNVTRSEALDQARTAEGRPEPDNATALVRALEHLRRRPWSRGAALIAARCLSRLDYAELAEPYYRRAGRLGRDDLLLRALGLVRAVRRDEAIAVYQEILRSNPEDLDALGGLATVYWLQMRYAEAHDVADRIAAAPGGEVAGPMIRAMVYHKADDPESAVPYWEEVLRLDPELKRITLPAYEFWREFLDDLWRSRSLEVIPYLEPLVARDGDPVLRAMLGEAYMLQGRLEEADRIWRRLVEQAPSMATPWAQLGLIALNAGRLDEAAADLERARKLSGGTAPVFYNLARVYRLLAERTAAAGPGREAEADRLIEMADRYQAEYERTRKPPSGGMGAGAKPMPMPMDEHR